MAEEAPATAPSKAPAKAPAKAPRKKKASGAKTEGPSITKLIIDAVTESKERKGTSAAAIKKYLADKGIDVAKLNKRINKSLTSLVEKGALTQVKGAGASGSFKLAKKDVKPVKPKVLKPKTPVKVRKPVAKKNRPVKKQAAKKPAAAAKKVSKKSSPKKTVKNAKSPKRTPVKKEKVKAKATATKRSPVKKPVKKSTAKKSAAKKTKK